MARFQCLEEEDYTDFELERQILSSEYKGYKPKHTEERYSRKYDRERHQYTDRYKDRDKEREGRKPRQREKLREQREARIGIDRYKNNEGATNPQEGHGTRRKEEKANAYHFEFQKRERKRDGVSVRPKREQEREKYRDTKEAKPPKKRVTLVEKHFGDRLYHSDSEIDLMYTRTKSANAKLRDALTNKPLPSRTGNYGNEYQWKESRKPGNEERGKNKYRKYYTDKGKKGIYETFAMKRAKTKSSPELRESSSAEFLDRSRDSSVTGTNVRRKDYMKRGGQKGDSGEGADSGARPRDGSFRARMFQLLIQHVKDLTQEVQNHKEEKKQLTTQLIVLEEEAKALKERARQPESLAFKKRQTKKLDETFSALRNNNSGFAKNPSFKKDLRNILAEVQGKYYAQLREHEIRIQEVQEKAENDIQDLMKNIVDKYVKVSEIKERQQQIDKLVGSKKAELASDDVQQGNGSNKNDDFNVGRPNILSAKNSQMTPNTEAKNATQADRERPYQFYFPENRARLREKYKTSEQANENNTDLVRARPTNFGTPLLENGKTGSSGRLMKSPGTAAGSPVATNTYEYWHSRLTQGVKGKGSYLRNAT